ncbi:uncharacterized protein KLLA0_C04433g [Kluyveromyces lactis]|uniref:KLLA0C04433p n=1 Tax=Kluyveromyces lactis (strain ATCC 8585 / CBS 2359 / DSM 70799 / NBRC 1267 / NRRL Y-1140 / WM37) TaxID=284590 RepID=Q6CUJ4_KLULA|nr:uncharacterized protein KLLA0_C04433g [Kluyveromyces lactis]CAH01246.1 KLLA0C04433p [Kluyveromyces lactis]|eukprot:XP_452395.1 uncharacterized protein KLLA0_C04433g [Kluyveromyces lactis]
MRKELVIVTALSLIVTGCINSIATKYQDNQCVRDCDSISPVLFEQPVLQTLQMFIGEISLMFVMFWQKYNSRNGYEAVPSAESLNKTKLPSRQSYALALPAICDICGTTLMNLALTMIPVSIYQMTRGVLILFVALFSVFFLKHKISRFEWLSLFIVVFGVFLVGYSGNVGVTVDVSLVTGVLLIVLAQVCTATQFVLEEHIMSKWIIPPSTLVAFEGIYGASITLLTMLIASVTFAQNKQNSSFNIVYSLQDMFVNPRVLYSSIIIMISIACFNFFGITLTNSMNATVRSTIDTCRTLLVWLVSLSLGWESFKLTQFNGFVLLVLGTLLFNGAITIDKKRLPQWLTKDYPGDDRIINVIDEEVERF